MSLDKVQVARHQLGTALALFVDDCDPVSVHCLACGGGEITEYLAEAVQAQPFKTHILQTFPAFNAGDIRGRRNRYWNAFKHATTKDGRGRDDEQLLARFSDEQNDHALFIAWYDYGQALGRLPIEAQVFQVWYFACYKQKLSAKVDPDQFEKIFSDLHLLTRSGRKAQLRQRIAWARKQGDVMDDPRTEQGPLLISSPSSASPPQAAGDDPNASN